MANATSSSGAQSAVKSPQQRRRSKRPAGVPIAMIAVIVVVALFFGGLAGYAIGVRSNGYRKQYEAAQEKITTLENQMALIRLLVRFLRRELVDVRRHRFNRRNERP